MSQSPGNEKNNTGSNEPRNNEDEVNNDITQQEINLLDSAGTEADNDEEALHDADLDSTDADGTPLNEKASARDRSGRDLDVPGSEADNDMEDIGGEDEENNSYSLPDQE